jgi:hypothetical protein
MAFLGYPGPYPQVGSQVASLGGASNDFTELAMIDDAEYRRGDLVAAIVYDGMVWARPDFLVTFNPQSGMNRGILTSYPTDSSTAVAYDLRIDKAGPASAGWYAPQTFNLKFVFNNGPLPAESHVTLDGVELTARLHIRCNVDAGWGGTVRIYNTEASRSPISDRYQSHCRIEPGSGAWAGSQRKRVRAVWVLERREYHCRLYCAFHDVVFVRQGGSCQVAIIWYW